MTTTAVLPKLAFTIPEAAQSAGVTDKTIRTAINAGHLRAKRQSVDKNGDPCGKYLIPAASLEAWLDGLADA